MRILLSGISGLFRRIFLALIWFYRHGISPFTPPACRYHPTCSAYAEEAIQTHGPGRGLLLSVWRVLRCNPFARGGLDPVPPVHSSTLDCHEGPGEKAHLPVANPLKH